MNPTENPMTDSAMCNDTRCPDRRDCWRYAGKPANNQTYAKFPRAPEQRRCAQFVPLRTITMIGDEPVVRYHGATVVPELETLILEVVRIARKWEPDLTWVWLCGTQRSTVLAASRAALVLLARRYTRATFPQIASAYGRPYHSSAVTAVRRFVTGIMVEETSRMVREIVSEYERMFHSQMGVCEAGAASSGDPSGANGADRRDPRGPAAEDAA